MFVCLFLCLFVFLSYWRIFIFRFYRRVLKKSAQVIVLFIIIFYCFVARLLFCRSLAKYLDNLKYSLCNLFATCPNTRTLCNYCVHWPRRVQLWIWSMLEEGGGRRADNRPDHASPGDNIFSPKLSVIKTIRRVGKLKTNKT